MVVELFPDFGHRVVVYEEHYADAEGHEQKGEAEQGIQLAYQFVYGQQRSRHVVAEDYHYPEGDVEVVDEDRAY